MNTVNDQQEKQKKHKIMAWITPLIHRLRGHPKNKTQLIRWLHRTAHYHLLDNDALSMIEGVLKVSDMQVRDILIPRPQMIVINKTATVNEAVNIIVGCAHSRFPVVSEDRTEVLGILLAKELLPYASSHTAGKETTETIKNRIHPAMFVPESKRLDKLLKEFKLKHNHMAIVVGEHNDLMGLVTLEDVLEQIVGNIEDEFDVDETHVQANIAPYGKNHYIVQGLTPIEVFNHYFNTTLDDKYFDTVGGVIAQHFGRLPEKGDSTHLAGLTIHIDKVEKRRITVIKVHVR